MPAIEKKEILFIINPNSGNKKASKLIQKIHSIDSDIEAVVTRNLEELENIFRINIEKFTAFILVGGDGSVNEAIKYLINRNDKILGVFPAGSGNGFARELGFKKNIQTLIEDVKKGETLFVDILSVNNKNCINVAGLGFDSFVAHQFQKSKSRGFKNYIVSTLKSITTFRPFYAEIIIDSMKLKGEFQMITIANTRQFGNNAIISPQSIPNDGIFELVLVKQFPFYLYPKFVIKMFRGTLKDSKYISYFKVKKQVEITSTFNKYHIDGEPKVFDENLSVQLLTSKLRVLKTTGRITK